MYSINACEKQYGNQKPQNGKTTDHNDYPGCAHIKISHLWQCGEWTHGNMLLDIDCHLKSININATNYDAIYGAKVIGKDLIHEKSFFMMNHRPKLSVIKSHSLNHSLLLSKLCLIRCCTLCSPSP